MGLRVIGDCHQRYDRFIPIVEDALSKGLEVVQLGDLGFDYEALKHIRFSVIKGNHDDYTKNIAGDLGDFGVKILGGITFWFVRGEFSIDKANRLAYRDWWPEEEISARRLDKAIKLYEKIKPDLVITHGAPRSIINNFSSSDILKSFGFEPTRFSTRTSEALEQMFQIHQPKQHYFGHFHKRWSATINGTMFRCLDELEFVDIL